MEQQQPRSADYAEALEADADVSGARCDDLVEAASYWRMADKPDREEQALLAAVDADTGNCLFDPRAAYGDFLMHQGRTDEAEKLFAEVLHGGSLREQTYMCAAHAFAHAGRSREALRWFNVGAQRLFPDLAEIEYDLAMGDNGFELLRERDILRRELGEPTDAVDEAFAWAMRRGAEVLHNIEDIQRASQDDTDPVLYWPEREFDELRRRFPDSHLHETHTQHRQSVEASLRSHSRTNAAVALVSGSVSDYLRYAGQHDLRADASDPQLSYAADLLRQGDTGDWPPERNQPCWCGSGRKYKKCCGSPGFIDR